MNAEASLAFNLGPDPDPNQEDADVVAFLFKNNAQLKEIKAMTRWLNLGAKETNAVEGKRTIAEAASMLGCYVWVRQCREALQHVRSLVEDEGMLEAANTMASLTEQPMVVDYCCSSSECEVEHNQLQEECCFAGCAKMIHTEPPCCTVLQYDNGAQRKVGRPMCVEHMPDSHNELDPMPDAPLMKAGFKISHYDADKRKIICTVVVEVNKTLNHITTAADVAPLFEGKQVR